MSIETKLTKVKDQADPNRCQSITTSGQCPFFAEEGIAYCPMHKARHNLDEEENNCRIYRLSKWQERVDQIANNDKVKSLREEVGLARVLLEEIWNKCQDSTTLLMYSSKIADLLTRIEKLVVSCNRLEQSTGMLLDKTAALNMAMRIVQIIGDHVNNEEIIDAISQGIIEVILSQQTKAPQLTGR